MTLRFALLVCSLPLSLAAGLAACGSNPDSTAQTGAGGTSTGQGGSGGTTSTSGAGGDDGGLLDINQPDGGGGGGPTLVYAHTDTTLFTLDPTSATLDLTLIGDFDCIGGSGEDTAMTDVAVDRDQHLFGISANAVHPLTLQSGSVVHCEPEIQLNNPQGVRFYGLSFAPVGILDPAREVLVGGNSAGELWAIDAQGNLSQHGIFGDVPADDGNGNSYDSNNVGQPWELSGDIVFLENQGSPVGFATVRDCPNPPSTQGCNFDNTLIEIDMTKLTAAGNQPVIKAVRGKIVKRQGCTDQTNGVYGNMYGVAAWNAKVYGFSRTGNLVDIDTSDGAACLVHNYPGRQFAGAGVTTLAPVLPPPPK